MGGGGESARSKARRREARQVAKDEQIRTAMEQANSATMDFTAAFGRPSLFQAGTIMRQRRMK